MTADVQETTGSGPRAAASGWLVDPTVAYLNHGGFGALPVAVADAAARIRLDIEADPTDMFTRRWQDAVDGVRARVAQLLRGRPEDMVFVGNATTGTATVINSLGLQAGDEILATDHRYPAVANQAAALASRGVSVVESAVSVDVSSVDEIVATVLAGVTGRTRLLIVDHIASPTGFVFPVRELVAAGHAAGLPVLVDAAHAPGQIDVDLEAIGADFWVGNLHKWVCSPRACAVVQVAPQWQDEIRPLVVSHGYGGDFRASFDLGATHDPVPLLAVPAALDFWDDLGWDDVRRRQRELAGDGARYVAERLGTRVAVAEEFTASMRLVQLPQPLTAAAGVQVGYRLTTEHKVTAYITHHQGSSYVRMCGQLYNTPEHYERLGDALADLLL
jgi:isopenicillin-N epimerase